MESYSTLLLFGENQYLQLHFLFISDVINLQTLGGEDKVVSFTQLPDSKQICFTVAAG